MTSFAGHEPSRRSRRLPRPIGLAFAAALGVASAAACTTNTVTKIVPANTADDGSVVPEEAEEDGGPVSTCTPKKTCRASACGTIPDGCGGTLACGSCDDSNGCTADSCVAGDCVHAPSPDLSSCAKYDLSLCSGGACRALHARCTASNPSRRAYYTYWITPDPDQRNDWDVGDDCVCNGNTLETLFNGSLGPTITVACSKCVKVGTFGNVYCFK